MEPIVVSEDKGSSEGNGTLRGQESTSKLRSALESFANLLRNEPKTRPDHTGLSNCFNVCYQYLNANTVEEVKSMNLNVVRDAMRFIDTALAMVKTNADSHEYMLEVMTLLSNDFMEVSSKVG